FPEGSALPGSAVFRRLPGRSEHWLVRVIELVLDVPRGAQRSRGSALPGSAVFRRLPGRDEHWLVRVIELVLDVPREYDVLWKLDVPEGGQQQKGRQLSAFLITSHLLQQHRPDVARQYAESAGELGGGGAVDGAVVVGQGQRQHQPRLEGLAVPDRLHGCPADAEDGHLRCVDDRR